MSYSFSNPIDDPLTLESSGLPRFGLGLIPATAEERASLPRVYSAFPQIPKDRWHKISSRQSRPFKILNQGQHGSCVGHGTATAANKLWVGSRPSQHVFSSCFCYGMINGGRDAGASIVAAFQSLQRDGICTEDEVPEGLIYKSQFPPKAFEVAKRFRGWPGFVAHDIDEWVSGILAGGQGVFGVCVGGAFQAYRGEGLLKVGFGSANHCVSEDGFDPTQDGGVIDLVNSWGNWGENGHGRIRLADIARDELYVLMGCPDDPQEASLPPKVEHA